MRSLLRNVLNKLKLELLRAAAKDRRREAILYGLEREYGRRSAVPRAAHAAYVVRKTRVAALDERPV